METPLTIPLRGISARDSVPPSHSEEKKKTVSQMERGIGSSGLCWYTPGGEDYIWSWSPGDVSGFNSVKSLIFLDLSSAPNGTWNDLELANIYCILIVSSRLIHYKPYVLRYDMTAITILLVRKLRHLGVKQLSWRAIAGKERGQDPN